MRFRVYELQEEIRHRRWLYEVDAATGEAAIAKAKDADADPIDCGEQGDSYFGRSWWSAAEVVAELDDAGFDAGFDRATADLPD